MKKDESKIKRVMTLGILRKGDNILLGLKKVRMGAGNYNGFGSKLEPNETIENCLIREIKEESGLDLLEFEKRGVIIFKYLDSTCEVHLFEGISWQGEAIETEEMAPVWFSIADLPYNKMWADDEFWYPLFLERKFFNASFTFDQNHKIVDYEISENTSES